MVRRIGSRAHGLTGTPEWRAWRKMKARCTNPNQHGYNRYGGRGIIYCAEWEDFEPFLAHMGSKPTPRHTLDRIDNDGNYEPGNVRWATRKEQGANRSDNSPITHNGRTMLASEWARETGLKEATIRNRVRDQGWTPEDALTVAPRITGRPFGTKDRPLITFNGEAKTIAEWSRQFGLSQITLRGRLVHLGWSVEKALTTPVKKGR